MATMGLETILRTGRVIEALHLCREEASIRSQIGQVRCAEVLLLAGELEDAERTAVELRRSEHAVSESLSARCELVIAAYHQEHGHRDAALEANRRALRFAEISKD